MNVVITAEVTYEITGIGSIEEAKQIFFNCVSDRNRHVENVYFVGLKEMFATQMNNDGTISSVPNTWELGEM